MLSESKTTLENATDASTAFRNIIRGHRIVFLGEDDHIFYNMDFFLQENIQLIYDEGVRYIFTEGSEVIDEEDKPLEGTFYPWMYVGGRYGDNFFDTLERFNQTIAKDDPIQMIYLETGRKSFPPNEKSIQFLYNYRSKYMADIMLTKMKQIDENKKCLVLAGSLHGVIEPYSGWQGGEFITNWKALGVYLKEYYENEYFAIQFITLESLFDASITKYLEWEEIPDEAKFLTTEIWFEDYYAGFQEPPAFDGYIVEKNPVKVIPFEYAVHDKIVLEKMLAYLEYLDAKVSLLNGEYDYTNPQIYYLLDDYVRVIYYIKLYFGSDFEYSLWNPTQSLAEALNDFKQKTSEVSLTDIVILNVPSDDELKIFNGYMHTFNTSLLQLEDGKKSKDILKNSIADILNAKSLIPQDLWTTYWLALMHTEAEFYDEALGYWQSLLSEPLAKSMLIYPESLELASICAEKLGKENLSSQYLKEKESLWNERKIDVSKIFLNNS